ncbi:Tai4 [Escherichia phage UE-S5b]
MKTLIAVAVVALSVLSFNAQASSRETLLDAAADYKANNANFVNQGYFMGMVTMGVEAGKNCVPDSLKLGNVFDKVATIILYDRKVNAVKVPSDMVLMAIDTAYPCIKS